MSTEKRQAEAPAAAPSQGREKRYRGACRTGCNRVEEAQGESWQGLLSQARLGVYCQDGAGQDVALRRHWLNLRICESLYPTLQLLEVTLRNRLTGAFDQICGSGWMGGDDLWLDSRCEVELARVRKTVSARKPRATRDDILSELSLGFWCALHGHHYEQASSGPRPPFPAAIRKIYPGMPKSRHSRKLIKGDLERLRRLRNRVFHHERILHWTDLPQQVTLTGDYITWMGENAGKAHQELSRFAERSLQSSAGS